MCELVTCSAAHSHRAGFRGDGQPMASLQSRLNASPDCDIRRRWLTHGDRARERGRPQCPSTCNSQRAQSRAQGCRTEARSPMCCQPRGDLQRRWRWLTAAPCAMPPRTVSRTAPLPRLVETPPPPWTAPSRTTSAASAQPTEEECTKSLSSLALCTAASRAPSAKYSLAPNTPWLRSIAREPLHATGTRSYGFGFTFSGVQRPLSETARPSPTMEAPSSPSQRIASPALPRCSPSSRGPTAARRPRARRR